MPRTPTAPPPDPDPGRKPDAGPAWSAEFTMYASDALNENHRRHWASVASRRRELRRWAAHLAAATRAPRLGRARVTATVRLSAHGRWAPTVKPLLDGLVDAGVLPDDDAAHLEGPYLTTDPTRSPRRLGSARRPAPGRPGTCRQPPASGRRGDPGRRAGGGRPRGPGRGPAPRRRPDPRHHHQGGGQ